MVERVCRDGDESIYQPRIHADRIKDLYKIGLETGLPITVLVDYAIRSYVIAFNEEKRKNEEARNEYEFRRESENEDYKTEHEFDDLDRWEDGSLFDY
jgi:hypothetical protein